MRTTAIMIMIIVFGLAVWIVGMLEHDAVMSFIGGFIWGYTLGTMFVLKPWRDA